jgi:hypothetical protein
VSVRGGRGGRGGRVEGGLCDSGSVSEFAESSDATMVRRGRDSCGVVQQRLLRLVHDACKSIGARVERSCSLVHCTARPTQPRQPSQRGRGAEGQRLRQCASRSRYLVWSVCGVRVGDRKTRRVAGVASCHVHPSVPAGGRVVIAPLHEADEASPPPVDSSPLHSCNTDQAAGFPTCRLARARQSLARASPEPRRDPRQPLQSCPWALPPLRSASPPLPSTHTPWRA